MVNNLYNNEVAFHAASQAAIIPIVSYAALALGKHSSCSLSLPRFLPDKNRTRVKSQQQLLSSSCVLETDSLYLILLIFIQCS